MKNNLNNNSKTVAKVGDVASQSLISFSKEWKNLVYYYNKNSLKNIPVYSININKIIKGYFNLYFKENKYLSMSLEEEKQLKNQPGKYIFNTLALNKRLKKKLWRRKFLRRVYVSNAEIKHTNSKVMITLYSVNRENNILNKKYLILNKKIGKILIKRYFLLYKNNITKIHKVLVCAKSIFHSSSLKEVYNKKKFLKSKLEYLNKFLKLKTLYIEKISSIIIKRYLNSYLILLRKYDLIYSLNQYKFSKQKLLPGLSKILKKILEKKIEYNIINVKSIAFNTDLFTNALALKFQKKRIYYKHSMFSILNRAYLPDKIKQTTLSTASGSKLLSEQLLKERFYNIISNINAGVDFLCANSKNIQPASSGMNLNRFLETRHGSNQINNIIYNSIGYKNMGGIRLEVKGRLTKRYRADRSVYSVKWKGGLKNVDSSLSTVLFRGNSNCNVSYSIYNSKRRIGAFAVKGWISGVNIN